MVDVYQKQVRAVLELAVPVWQPGITRQEQYQIERVQKCAMSIILGDHSVSYTEALDILDLETLEVRRRKICENFVRKAAEHPKFMHWFKINSLSSNSKVRRSKKTPVNRYLHVQTRTTRYRNSPLPYLTEILNNMK